MENINNELLAKQAAAKERHRIKTLEWWHNADHEEHLRKSRERWRVKGYTAIRAARIRAKREAAKAAAAAANNIQ